MRTGRTTTLVVLMASVLSATPASAQAKVTTAQERANLKLVLDWWREVVVSRHVELAPKYMAENYIQHNPNISTGRAAFVQAFGRQPPRAVPPALANPPAIQFAKGDYVVFVWKREGKEPADPNKTYTYHSFDIVRVQNGKVQEHWDSAYKLPAEPGQSAVVPGVGPAPVYPKNSPEEARNEAMVDVLNRDIFQYGHAELAAKVVAEGYIQHNPNVGPGRAGLLVYLKSRQPEPLKAEWKDRPPLVITSGNLVLTMFNRYSVNPADSSKIYRWNWFDLDRVDDGMIQEHWDSSMKTPPPRNVPPAAGVR